MTVPKSPAMVDDKSISVYMPPAESNQSPNLRATLAFFKAISEWDLSKMMACLDDTVASYILPRSLGIPVLDKSRYEELTARTIRKFRPIEMTIHEVIEGKEDDKIVVHASGKGESKEGVPYANEYMFIFKFKPSAVEGELPKIVCKKEFVDSLTVERSYGKEGVKLTEQ